jgi:hypothetical protein
MKRLFVVSNIETPADVRQHLADPERHWREGYSAFELAHSWVEAGDFPSAVKAVLERNAVFQNARLVEAFFEKKVDLETPGRPSQNDILAYVKILDGFATIAVEGKVKEPFDKYVRDKDNTTGVAARVENLCERLGVNVVDVQRIRYQLLHRTVSAILEAERYFAEHALMLVHSFDGTDSSFADYRDFAELMGFPREKVVPNQIVGFKELGTVKVHLGWVRDVSTMRRAIVPHSLAGVRPQTQSMETPKQNTGESDTLSDLAERIMSSGHRGVPKKSSSISSNISSGFKARTGGQDYKSFYDDSLRSQIADWGAQYGVQVALIVDLVVEMKDLSRQEKRQNIADISRALRSS